MLLEGPESSMKSDDQIRNNMRAISNRLWPLLVAGLLAAAAAGCSGREPEPVVVAQAVETTQATESAAEIVEEAAAPALQPVEPPADTATPTTIPTLTPLPTASNTATPAIPPTAAPTETATTAPLETIVSTETAEPAKPPPLPTPSGVYSWTLRVPILMYHYVSEPPRDADKYRRDLSVPPQKFEQQMAYLADNGFEAVDLYDLSLAITSKRELPEKPVVISFDDGYLDNYENAFPIMQDYGMKGTFFVITEFIDEGREGYMTWDMVKEMSEAGMRIESHSKTHPDLSTADRDHVIYEALGSMETIEAHIGYTPRYFCYPSGRYNEETMAILEELGYWGAVTTADGPWHGFDDRFEWSRSRMRYTTALPEFADMVSTADTVSGKPPADG